MMKKEKERVKESYILILIQKDCFGSRYEKKREKEKETETETERYLYKEREKDREKINRKKG